MHPEDLTKKLKTTEEANTFLAAVDAFSHSLYTTSPKGVEAFFPLDIAELLKKGNSGGDWLGYLNALKLYLLSIKPVKITLATDPDGLLIDNIYDWALQLFGDPVILDISYDPIILGGAVIAYGGLYYDGSLLAALNTRLTRFKSEVVKV